MKPGDILGLLESCALVQSLVVHWAMTPVLQAGTRKLLGPALREGLPLPAVAHLVSGLLQGPAAGAAEAAGGRVTANGSSCETPTAAEAAPASPSFLACLPSRPRNPSRGEYHTEMAALYLFSKEPTSL